MRYSVKDLISIIFLWPFSALYSAIYFLRRGCYRFGLFESAGVKLPVICVGNLTVGGTGKSPFCIMLAETLSALGYKPAILSRGYKRSNSEGSGNIAVSDWHGNLAEEDIAGDEPYLMASKLLERAIVIVGKNRISGASLAEKMGADIIIMDDGFQYWKLSRSLDIVLLDGNRPLGNGWLLPAGRLREPAPALMRAGIIVATRCHDGGQRIKEVMQKHHLSGPLFYCDHKTAGFKAANQFRKSSGSALPADKRLLLFCGIARPDSFENSVKALGYVVSQHIIFGDHHSYSPADLERISKAAVNCDAVVTTEKDAVKLPKGWDPGNPLLVLGVEMAFQPESEKEKFIEMVRRAVKR